MKLSVRLILCVCVFLLASLMFVSASAPLAVFQGGTGRSTISNNALLYGGTGQAMNQLATGTGVLQASGGAPSYATAGVAIGGTGATTLTGLLQGNGTSAFSVIANSSTVGQTLRVTGASAYGWGALDLADGDAITGDIPDANLSANVPLLNASNTFTGATQTIQNSTDFFPQINIKHIGSTAGSAGYVLFGRARAGTTDVVNGDTMGTFIGQGYSNAAYNNSSWFTFIVDGTVSGATVPGAIQFVTVNSSGVAGVRVKLNSTGITSLYSGAAVASAATITPTGNLFHVTGTTTITSVSGTGITAGTQITIIFDGILTFTDGSNLKLVASMVTTADDTITLVYDGTNWYEVARAIN